MLIGKRVIVTRNKQQASTLCSNLKTLGAEVIELPTIDIRPVSDFNPIDVEIKKIKDYSWLVFTSANAVEIFFSRLFALNFDTAILIHLKVVVIGKQTANSLKPFDIIPDLIPSVFTSEATVDAFRLIKDQIKGTKVLIPTSAIARDVISSALKDLGAEVNSVAVYENVIPEYTDEKIVEIFSQEIDLVTFTSSSTVINLIDILIKHHQEHIITQIKGASIGPATTKTARENNVNIIAEAKKSTIDGLLDAVVDYFKKV